MINISALSKTFGPVTAVDHIDLQIPSHIICGLVGPDGAGKTTLMRMICGLVNPDQGEIKINGLSPGSPKGDADSIGYMPQRFSLYGDLTVMENIHFLGSLYNIDRNTRMERAHEILELTGLKDFKKRLAVNLSGGMKQKLALTCALIIRPALLVLDEPTYGVDPESRKEFWRILYQLNKGGMTILVSTPYMDEAELCHHVLFINQGRITATGSPLELRQQFGHQVLEVRTSARNPHLLDGLVGVLDVSYYGSRYRLVVDDAPEAEKVVRDRLHSSGVNKVSISSVPPTMEDVFVFLAEKEEPHGVRH